MSSLSLSQYITDLTKAKHYIPESRGQYIVLHDVKSLARNIGMTLVAYPEDEVKSLWDDIYQQVLDENEKRLVMKESFYLWVKGAWVESWMRRTHDVFKDKDRVVLMPTWANLAANVKWLKRENLDDVIAGLQKDKVPYLTMERSVYEVLKEKWGVQ